MAYKITKKEVNELSTVHLLRAFENCCTVLSHEANFRMGGETKTTSASYELLKNRLLDELSSDLTYDEDGKIIERVGKKK